jgi:AraC family transcriptional regulator
LTKDGVLAMVGLGGPTGTPVLDFNGLHAQNHFCRLTLSLHPIDVGGVREMRVAVDVLGTVREPYIQVYQEQFLCMLLRPGAIEGGVRRSKMTRTTYDAGEIGLCPRHVETWMRTEDVHVLKLGISDSALTAACDGGRGEVELRCEPKLADPRVRALVGAANAERVAGFPSGRLYLDSVEQALALALVDAYAVRQLPVRMYRGGLGPGRLRRVVELVHSKMDSELSLEEMAKSAGLSTAHFARMFHKSTGETPHQFVLRHRIERAKEMLRSADARVIDVTLACGFKTQARFTRVFRSTCGITPAEFKREVMC